MREKSPFAQSIEHEREVRAASRGCEQGDEPAGDPEGKQSGFIGYNERMTTLDGALRTPLDVTTQWTQPVGNNTHRFRRNDGESHEHEEKFGGIECSMLI